MQLGLQSQDNAIPSGQQKPASTWGEFNNIAFMVQQALGKMQTATLVRIEACTNAGGLSPVGFVDVTPLVNQLDSAGTPTPHSTIHNVPYFRLQGGANAIIIDPQKGDIGVCVFASRDISKVKSTKKQANPGSFRRYDFSDGLYLGGMLNGQPTQYIQFNADGIKIYSPTKISVEAPIIEATATTSATVTAPQAFVVASVLAKVTAPAIQLGASGQSLLSFVTSAFQNLFNTHTHPTPSGQSSAPSQSMGASHMTSTVKGG